MKYQLLYFFTFVCYMTSNSQDYKKYLDLSYDQIDSLMDVEYNNGAIKSAKNAILLMQAGRKKARKEFGEQDSIFVAYTNSLAFYYHQTNQVEKAANVLTEMKNIMEKALGPDHPDLSGPLNNLAYIHTDLGNYDKALPLYLQATKIDEKVFGSDHPRFAFTLGNLAALYYYMRNFEEALPLYIKSNKIQEKELGAKHPDFARSLNNLAVLHQDMDNYDKALPLFIQVKNIREEVFGKEHPIYAETIGNLGAFYRDMGKYDEALVITIEAKEIMQKIYGPEHRKFVHILSNLASIYRRKGNLEEALTLHLQVKRIEEKILGLAHPKLGHSLNSLAVVYKDLGLYDKALEFFTEAKGIHEKALGTKHPFVANNYNYIANIHILRSEYATAWEYLMQALEISSTLNLSSNISLSWCDSLRQISFPSKLHLEKMIQTLGNFYLLLDKDNTVSDAKTKKIFISDLALDLLNKRKNQVTNEKDKLRMLSQSNNWLLRNLNLINPKDQADKAFVLSDQNKSVLLLQASKSDAAYLLGNLPDSLVWKDKKMLKKQSELQAKLLEKRPTEEIDNLRAALIGTNQEIDEFQSLIKKKYPQYFKLKYQQVEIKVKDIQALLNDHTALLEYVIGDSVIHVFYIDKKQIQWSKSFVSNKEIQSKIKSLHNILSNYGLIKKDPRTSYQQYTQSAHWFYKHLMEPVLKDKQNIKNLIIVTDGQLGHLPFETFLVEAAPQQTTDYSKLHFLVNDYSLSYNYSATLWKENIEAPAPQNNGQILGMAANYNLHLDSSLLDRRLPTDQWLRDKLYPLPAARTEVEALEKEFNGFFAFDTLASEKTVKKIAKDYAILHFAMHGILDTKKPILSSLAFSEDNDSIESNFWQAHEISKMHLNANLVVLSACETGYGRFEQGNGIASLSRAFMYAGASALVVTLWQVNDQATAEIMQNLYHNLADGMKKDEALQQAKLQYIKSKKGIMSHPAFWSPFVQIGNTKQVNISRKGELKPWLIGSGILLLVLGLLLIVRRKKDKEQVKKA